MKIKTILIALAAGGTFAASNPLAATARSDQTFPIETRTFRDWKVVCDNINTCAAYAPAEGNTGYVLVRIDAGPDAKPKVHANNWSLPSVGGRKDLIVDGRTFPGEEIQEADAVPVMTFLRDADQLIEAIGNARNLWLSSAGETMPVTASGAAEAFLWIDERQGRLGTTTALICKGERPASAVPAAPSPPRRIVAAPVSLTNRPQTMPAAVFAHEKLSACNADNREPVSVNSGWSVHALGSDTLLWSIPCGYGAYNTMEAYLTSKSDGSEVQVVSFPSSRGSAAILVNSDYDNRTNTISAFSKSRGPADCGQNASWGWNGNSFALVEENTMDDCLGIPSDLWPSLWRTQT